MDVVQSTLTVTRGHGWYNDPYKQTRTFYPSGPPEFMFDTRPESRDMLSWFTRYRRHFPGLDATLQAEYRFFDDDWDVRAHAIEAGWHQQIDERWAVRPALRYYTQDAARFYAITIPRPQPEELSSDPRLAACSGDCCCSCEAASLICCAASRRRSRDAADAPCDCPPLDACCPLWP